MMENLVHVECYVIDPSHPQRKHIFYGTFFFFFFYEKRVCVQSKSLYESISMSREYTNLYLYIYI